jgi:hypothetical protein
LFKIQILALSDGVVDFLKKMNYYNKLFENNGLGINSGTIECGLSTPAAF